MNASTYLQSQGWRGPGHSLDHDNRGLAKPLLVSRKSDLAGLGNKKNDFGTQWWTNAFDKSLKQFGNHSAALQPPLTHQASPGSSRGLYAAFVKADTLTGTINEKTVDSSTTRVETVNASMSPAMESTRRFGILGVSPSEASSFAVENESESKIGKKDKKRKREDGDVKSNEAEQEKGVVKGKAVKSGHEGRKSKKQKQDNGDAKGSTAYQGNGDVKSDRRSQKRKREDQDASDLVDRPPTRGEIRAEKRQKKLEKQQWLRKLKKANKAARKEKLQQDRAKALREKKAKAAMARTESGLPEPLPLQQEESVLTPDNTTEAQPFYVDLTGTATPLHPPQERKKKKEKKAAAKNTSGQAAPDLSVSKATLPTLENSADAGADYIHLGESETNKEKRKMKEVPRVSREQKKDKADKARDNVRAEKEATSEGKEEKKNELPEIPDPSRELRRPLHPDCILAMRERGEHVDLPGDKSDKDSLRYLLIQCLENGRDGDVKYHLNQALNPLDLGGKNVNDAGTGEALSRNQLHSQKYKRETAKREAKRDAKHWVDVRANPHLFKSDGTFISAKERGVPAEELEAMKKALKEAKSRAKAKRESLDQTETRRGGKAKRRAKKQTQRRPSKPKTQVNGDKAVVSAVL